jgi:hypothetical protein
MEHIDFPFCGYFSVCRYDNLAFVDAWVCRLPQGLPRRQGGQPAVRQGLDTPARAPTGGIRGEAAQGADQGLEGGRARGLEAENLALLDGLLNLAPSHVSSKK